MRALQLTAIMAAVAVCTWAAADPPPYPHPASGQAQAEFRPGESKAKAPAIGTIVHYYPTDRPLNASHWLRRTPPRPHAAIVTDQMSPWMVNLAVFQIDGRALSRDSIIFRHPGDPVPKDADWCELPPK